MTIPIDLGRDEARELAERELADPRYDTDVSWWQRVMEWLAEWIARLVDGAAGVLDGTVGLVILVAVVLLAILLLVWHSPVARQARAPEDAVFGTTRRAARDHRAAADGAAARRDWHGAVVERYRAIVATLEDRSVIDQRAGRTALEVARDAGAALPDLADRLSGAADLFDRVRYGDAAASATDDERLRDLDGLVRTARPARSTDLAVPR